MPQGLLHSLECFNTLRAISFTSIAFLFLIKPMSADKSPGPTNSKSTPSVAAISLTLLHASKDSI